MTTLKPQPVVAVRDATTGRGFTAEVWRLVVEKLPLFALVGACCWVTYWAQRVKEISGGTIPWRIGNALISYVVYLRQFFWPTDLALLYPRRGLTLPVWQVVGAGIVMLTVTVAVWACRRRCPYLLVGWLWYVGMLLPVIGLVPFGGQTEADRFTYLPQIGLSIAMVWGAADLCRSWPYRRWVCGITSALVLSALMAVAWRQTSYWHDSEKLWRRTLKCTAGDYKIHNLLGNALALSGRTDEAVVQFQKAVELKPDSPDAHYSLGVAATDRGRWDEAIEHFEKAIAAKPENAKAHNNLGYAWMMRREYFEALEHFKDALRIKPDFAEAHYNSGLALHALGHLRSAIVEYKAAIEAKPDYAEAYCNLGLVHVLQGEPDEAAECYRIALKLKPDYREARMALDAITGGRGR
jgi:tetratricopeptide (TPR) repeat protein